MATYQYYAYSSTALTYNATTHTFTLRADFDPARDRIIVHHQNRSPRQGRWRCAINHCPRQVSGSA